MRNIKVICTLAILMTTTITVRARVSFGEACGEGVRCDSRKSLVCNDGNCTCVKPDEMMYESDMEKCVVLVGEKCSYTAVEILTNTAQEKRYTEKLDCVKNAVCSGDGYCECKDTYFEGNVGVCTPKGLGGNKCAKTSECREDLHLVCDDNICGCDKLDSLYDPSSKQCVGIVGTPCRKYDQCVQNAYCRNSRYYNNNNNDNCSCGSGYQKSKEGLCLAEYGGYCNSKQSPCNEKFTCVEGKCTCHFPDHQTYRNNLLECASHLRGPCLEEVKGRLQSFSCELNASCKNTTGVHQCECNEGYIESLGRACKLSYNSSCGSTSLCDDTANLVCKEGKCLCKRDFQEYDVNINKCVGLVGSLCYDLNDREEECVKGAVCRAYRDTGLKRGTCQCLPAFTTTPKRKCLENTSKKTESTE